MRERFSNREWALLKALPLHVFALVAGADGTVDALELSRFEQQVRAAGRLENPLHRALMESISLDDLDAAVDEALDYDKAVAGAAAIKAVLQRELAPEAYQAFIRSVFFYGVEIAHASGGGAFDPSNVSREETAALNTVATLYDVTLEFKV